MPLEIKSHETEGVVILDLSGPLTLGPDDATLRQALQSTLDACKTNVVLNLNDVSKLDTAAVGTLTLWARRYQNAGGRLALLNVLPAHAALHDVLKLDTIFGAYDDELDAVNSFFPDRAVPHYDLLEFLKEESERKASVHPDRDTEIEPA